MKTEITPKMIEECKADLPPVKVQVGGRNHWGRTSGRKNRFCTVSLTNADILHSQSQIFWDAQFSWPAVCRAVVSGVALNGDF